MTRQKFETRISSCFIENVSSGGWRRLTAKAVVNCQTNSGKLPSFEVER